LSRSRGYYNQSDLPFFGRIAPNWTVCDHYFAAIMAETQPNRIYLHAAQTDCLTNRTTITLKLPTIWDILAQNHVSARYYHASTSFAQTPLFLWGFSYYSISFGVDDFYSDCLNGTLPSVSFVDPFLTSTTLADFLSDNSEQILGDDTGGNDDHPHSDIRNREAFLANVYNAIASSPNWSSTLLIITFDEWGGFFDHVPPPSVPLAEVPDADKVAYAAVNLSADDPTFGLRGFRVLCLVISPWARKGHVATNLFDHPSVLKLIENRWTLPYLTTRDLNANDLASVLDLDHPDFTPPQPLTESNVPRGPFGGPCPGLQIRIRTAGGIAVDWDPNCIKVVIETAPTPFGPWTEHPDVLAPPYTLSRAQMLQVAEGLMRLRIVR
jgi:phospholipase C